MGRARKGADLHAAYDGGPLMYQLVISPMTGEVACIKLLADNAFIPFDPANSDYQQYLAWIAEGNQPLPADAPPTE